MIEVMTSGTRRSDLTDLTTSEKLKEFSDAKLDTTQIENNAKAMMAYSKAMAGFAIGGPFS